MGSKSRIYDCYGILESIAWMWRASGVFPYTLEYQAGVKRYRINKFYTFYTFFICCACVLSFINEIIHFERSFSDPLSIRPITILVRATGNLTCMVLCGIGRIIRHKGIIFQLTEPIETMVLQDAFLEKFGCRLNYNFIAKIIRAYVWTMFSIIVTFMAYDFHLSFELYGRIAFAWIFLTIPLISHVMDLTILTSLVALLGVKFRALNDRIKIIAIRTKATVPKVIVTGDVCAENLRIAAKAHYHICAIGKRINSIFNLEVIINVVVAFVMLSTRFYYIFIEVEKKGDTDYVRIGGYAFWEFMYSFPIIVIVAICNWTSRQANCSGKLIHEIRVEKMDSQLYEALKSFSLQLHHQKLEFTAGGFFPLNSTLLQAMVGEITTHLVILIQFQPKLEGV